MATQPSICTLYDPVVNTSTGYHTKFEHVTAINKLFSIKND